MTDPDFTDMPIDSFSDLPMQPTGSGAADLEIAYEQMKLAEGGNALELSMDTRGANEIAGDDAAMTPTEIGDDATDSAAHPS